MHINDSKKLIKAYRKATHTNKSKGSDSGEKVDRKPEGGSNWKKKFK